MVSSNSIQGLVVFIVGASSFVGFYLYKKNGLNLLTLTYLISLLIFFCIAILGTLQRGLFKSILYKESVSIRGFYWRAAIEMFKDNPIFGVGTDQYGTFFRKYRESSYALRYGFEITSSNAHNVYLQFFATCGILVGVSYILLVLLIFKYGAQTLKSEDNHNLFFGGIFFAWIGYIIQGLISIDNISLGIWGWLLGGAVLSNSLERFKSNLIVKKSEITFLYSSFCIFITFIFCTFILRAEIDMQNQMRISNIENTSENRRYFIGATDKVFQNPVSPLFYKRIIAERLFDASETNLALNRINNLINKNPYICEYYYSRIIINQNLNNNLAVIKDQEKLLELDPWGAGNMYNLGLNYKYMGDYDGMNRIKNKLLKFAAESKIGNLARINLVSP
jgi:hypothetical protein